MTLNNTCDTPAAADVTLQYMIDECGCPGVLPSDPVKFATFDVGNRNLNEQRAEIEDPNAYGGTCYKSVSDGAASSSPFTFSFCRNRKLIDAALGSKSEFFPKCVVAAIDGIAPNILRHASIDFWALGYRPGMVTEVSGFNAQTEFNGKKIITAVTAEGVFPSEIEFYTNADTDEYPVADANETDQTDIALDGGYITYQGNDQPNIITERAFPDVTNESSTAGLYQHALGGVIESYSETFESGQFLTGSIDITYPVWDGSNAASLGSLGQEADCVCGDKVFFDPDDGRIVEVFFDGELICVTTANYEFTRAVQLSRNSCGKQTVGAKGAATGSITVPFTDATLLAKVRDKTTAPLLFVLWNDDRSQFETRLFPQATLSTENVDPDDEAQLLQEITFRANNDPDTANAAMLLQRNFLAATPPRNRFECTIGVTASGDLTKALIITGGDVGETVTVNWGDGTTTTTARTTTAAQTFSHAYADATASFDVIAWSNGDAPWTVIEVSAAGDTITEPSFCYLREYLASIVIAFAGTSLVLDNYPALTTVDITSSTLTSLSLAGTRVTTLDLSAATGMLAAGWDAILADLVASGHGSGTADLTGGALAPSAAGLADKAILVARGWTVTNN